MRDLTILQRDPYRLDTPANHRNGQWFHEQVARFAGENSRVHLRGAHYLISSAGDVRKPDRKLYLNNDPDWNWLSEHSARAARWLGYVPFERISDERNEEAELYISDCYPPWPRLVAGDKIELSETASDLMPRFQASYYGRQHYRIVLITEKSSLSPILRPIAQRIGGELVPMTGETSDTRIAELAARAALDGRPVLVLYFSDHDPSGWQMPISVSRKLQALRDLLYPGLSIQVRRAALTAQQANRLDLPSTPLKSTEKRAANWLAETGREQTELDALIALHPEALRQFALEAIEPFFDTTLDQRVHDAAVEWHETANDRLAKHPDYHAFAARIEESLVGVETAAEAYNTLVSEAYAALSTVEPPPVHVPSAELASGFLDEPLFTTTDDFISATRRLKAHKALEVYE
jgi:hypothetical protein